MATDLGTNIQERLQEARGVLFQARRQFQEVVEELQKQCAHVKMASAVIHVDPWDQPTTAAVKSIWICSDCGIETGNQPDPCTHKITSISSEAFYTMRNIWRNGHP